MSGGGSKTEYVTSNRTTEPAAFIKPFLEYGANEAQRLYQSELPSYFPQSTVVGFAPQQEMAVGPSPSSRFSASMCSRIA